MNQQQLQEILSYSPDTGIFRWKVTRGSRARAGDVAGSVNAIGYLYIGLAGKDRPAHRLAWLYVYGTVPCMLDHIDGNKLNNSISNLRPATKSTNGANRGPQANNTSGYKGVRWHKQRNRWVAQIHVRGRNTYLGLFDCIEDAAAAYAQAANQEYGEYARVK